VRSIVIASFLSLGLATEPSTPPRSTLEFQLAERDLFPESIAFDAKDRAYYVGSMTKRKIVRVAPDGTTTDFVPSKRDGLWAVLGMKIDPRRRELWVDTCHPGPADRPPMLDPEPASVGRAAVYRYDLKTGALVRRYEAPEAPTPLCFNDLVLGRDGNVFLSSGPSGIWRIAPGGTEVELFTAADGMFGNGIALSDDGTTIYLAVHDQGIAAVDVITRRSRVLPVPEAGAHVKGIDGLYLHDGALVGVQNGTEVHRIVRAKLSDDGAEITRVDVLAEDDPRFEVPTTGVIVDDALVYVATSQLDSIDPKTNEIWPVDQLVPNLFLRLELGTAEAPTTTVPTTGSRGGCVRGR
jgi:hypothetical protein